MSRSARVKHNKAFMKTAHRLFHAFTDNQLSMLDVALFNQEQVIKVAAEGTCTDPHSAHFMHLYGEASVLSSLIRAERSVRREAKYREQAQNVHAQYHDQDQVQ